SPIAAVDRAEESTKARRSPSTRGGHASGSAAQSSAGGGDTLLAPATDEAAKATKQGWLRVGGPTFAGGRVTIDRPSIGLAPYETELPAGSHTLTVVDPVSGHVLLHKIVHIGEHHTHVDALKILR